jgi:hypothetical protein
MCAKQVNLDERIFHFDRIEIHGFYTVYWLLQNKLIKYQNNKYYADREKVDEMNITIHNTIVTIQGCYQVLMRQSGIFNLLINAHYTDYKKFN